MAKIVSPILSAAAGTVGGAVYQRGSTGQHIKARTHTRQPRSDGQAANRQLLAQLAQTWQTLTPDLRDGWDQIAPQFPTHDRLGNTIQRTGYSLFVAVAMSQVPYTSVFPVQPPSPIPSNSPAIIQSMSLASSADGTSGLIQFLGSGFSQFEFFIITHTTAVSPGVTSLRRATYGGLRGFVAVTDTELDADSDSYVPPFLFCPGQRTGFRVIGFVNQWLPAPTIYVSAIATLEP